MKILWLNPSFLDYRIPVYKRINELSNNNFHIIFSKRRCKYNIPNKIKIAIGNNAVCFNNDKVYNIGFNHTLSNKHIDIPITWGLYKEIKKINPDIVIAEGFFQWTPIAICYCKKNNIPILIAYERTKWTERSCPKWRTLYRKFIDRYVSGYIVNGSLTKEYLIDIIHVDTSRIFIGGMSADSKGLTDCINKFDEKDLFKRSLNIKNGITYLYVGQVIERKGVKYLLDAWCKHIKKHNEDNLLIIGGGKKLNEYINKYKNVSGVYFSGAVDYDKVYKYYAISDVFIIPTVEDNWSLVVPEAMACGLPIATSIYNGCYPELVHEGINGKIFDTYNQATIIETLDYFHNIDLKYFGENSKKIEMEYNYINVSNRIYNAVKKVFTSSRK